MTDLVNMSGHLANWAEYPENLANDDIAKWYDLREQNVELRSISRKVFAEKGKEFAVRVFDYSVQCVLLLPQKPSRQLN